MEVRSDDELAPAFAAHEAWAFDEVYNRWGSLLTSAAYHVLGNTEDARDCLHDALTRLWRTPGAYTPARGHLRAFLAVCVRNAAISQQRSSRRRNALTDRVALEPITHDEISIPDFVENQKVRAALATLPEDHRSALVLAYYYQKTHTEIAAILAAPLGTIKSRISHGLRKLGAAMQSQANT